MDRTLQEALTALEAGQGQVNTRFDSIDAAIIAMETRTPAAPPADQQTPAGPGPASEIPWATVLQGMADGNVVDQDGNPVSDYQVARDVQMAARGRVTGIRKAISQLDGVAGQGIPWGSALFGGFIGLVGTEIIDGFMPALDPESGNLNPGNPLLKIAGAWVGVQFVSQFAGKTAGNITAAVFLVAAARVVLPFDEWVARLRDLILQKSTPTAQSNLNNGERETVANSLLEQPLKQFPGSGGIGTDRLAEVFN